MKNRVRYLIACGLILQMILFQVSCNRSSDSNGEDKIKETNETKENSEINEDSEINTNWQNAYDETLYHYERFLQGEESAKYGQEVIDIDFITKPKEEPDKHYSSKYAFWDSDMDGMPEVHVHSARYYYIIKYEDGKLAVWKSLSRDYELLNDGAFLEKHVFSVPTYEVYNYLIVAPDGSNMWEICFSMYDANNNYIHDEADEYYFDDVQVTKEQWEGLTERYLTIGSNEIEWVTIYAETD